MLDENGRLKVAINSEHADAIASLLTTAYPGLGLRNADTFSRWVKSSSENNYAAAVTVTSPAQLACLREYKEKAGVLEPILMGARPLKANVWIQFLIEPNEAGWRTKLYKRSLSAAMKNSISTEDQILLSQIQEKMKRRLFRVSLRALVFARDQAKAETVANFLGSAFASNEPQDSLKWERENPQTVLESMIQRKHLHPMILSSPELSPLILLPSPATLPGMNVHRHGLSIHPLPPKTRDATGLVLGHLIPDGGPLCLPLKAFLAHSVLLGCTGFGKSTLLLHIMHALHLSGWSQREKLPTDSLNAADLRDISLRLPRPEEAFALIVLDVEGELSHRLLRTSGDFGVTYYQPYDAPFTYNPLELHHYANPEDRDSKVSLQAGNVASSIGELTGLSERWSPRMLAILRKCLTALMLSKDNATLSELAQLLDALADQRRLDDVMKRLSLRGDVADSLRQYCDLWPRISESVFGLKYRLDVFLDSRMMRRTFSSPRSTFNFSTMILPGNLTILNLGGLDIPSNFRQALASMLLWRIWLTVLDRAKIVKEDRRWPVIVVADEFQLIASISLLSQILAEMRKNAMFIHLANQNITQLTDPLVASLLTNAALQIYLNLSGEDARRVANNMDPVLADEIMQTLVSLPKFQALIRMKSEDEYVAPYVIKCLPPPRDTHTDTEVQDALDAIREERLKVIDEMTVVEQPPWMRIFPLAEPPPASIFRIVLAVSELQAMKGAATLTGLSNSALPYIPKNKYTLSPLLEKASNNGYLRHVPFQGRETYQITEKAEAALFASADATAAAKAGLDAHRSLILEALWTYARKGYYPIRIDESNPQPGPDGIILPPHPFKNSWDYERAQALEAETYPEKHPDRVRWHVTNDLKNLSFHSVIFIVDSEEKKSAAQKATEQLEESLKSRTEIRILKSRA